MKANGYGWLSVINDTIKDNGYLAYGYNGVAK